MKQCPKCHTSEGLFAQEEVPFTLNEKGEWEILDDYDGPDDNSAVNCNECDWTGTVGQLLGV